MLADVAEAKALCEDGFDAIKAKSMAAVADARASYRNMLIKLEHMIEERLGRLRNLIGTRAARVWTLTSRARCAETAPLPAPFWCTTRVESAHFDWRSRERPALALLAWEALVAIQ
jgi:hypothetical protein